MAMRTRALRGLVWAVGVLLASGCSLLLDPDNCSSDDECNGGICQDGICIGGGGGDAEPDQADALSPPVDMADPDVSEPDEGPDLAPDMELPPDMAPPDMAPDPIRPTCALTAALADGAVTAADEVELTVSAADADTALDGLTATLDGEPVPLDAQGGAVLTRPLDEGDNRFALRVTDGETPPCEATLTLTRDATPPTIEGLTPPAGSDRLNNMQQFPIAGRVVDAHFTGGGPGELLVWVDGDPVEPEITWNGGDFDFVAPLEEGGNRVELQAVDDLGNASEVLSFSVRLDTALPVVLVDAPVADAQIFADRVDVRGRIQDDRQPVPGASYTIRVESGAQQQELMGIADEAGAFNRRVPLFMGQNTLTITGLDLAGNAGRVVRTVTRLAAAPCVTFTAPPDGSFTRVPQVDVAGDVCPAVDRLEVRIGGAEPIAVEPRAGRFQTRLALPGPGRHVITAAAFAGQNRAEDTVAITLDETAPLISISEPAEGLCTNARELRVCGQISDPESGIESLVLISGDQEYDVPPPGGGNYCQQVQVREGAGVRITARARNGALAQSEAAVTVRVDRVPPTLCIERGGQCLQAARLPWFGIDGSAQVTLEGRATWGTCSLASLTVDGLPVNVGMDGTFRVVRRFEDGPQEIEMRATDTAGNPAVTPFNFRVDGTPPALADASPDRSFFTTAAQERLEVEITDAGSGIVRISIGGQQVFAAPAGAEQGSAREVRFRVVELQEGQNRIPVEAVDLVGNTLSDVIEVRRDTTPPVVEVTSPLPDRATPAPMVVTGTVDDGPDGSGAAQITVNGVAAVIDPETGTWRADDVPLDPLDPELVVTAADALGNAIEPLIQPITLRTFGTRDPEIDGLDFGGPVGWMSIVDVDQNARPDLVVLGAEPDVEAMVFRQQAAGTFSAANAAEAGLPEEMTVRDAAAADLNADGAVDLFIVGVGRTAVALGNGVGGFSLVANTRIPPSADPVGLILGDITANGRLDAFVLAGLATRLYFSAGDGTFDQEALANLGLSGLRGRRAGRVLDLDGDGVRDVVAVGPEGAGLWIGDRFNQFVPAPPDSGFVTAPAGVVLPIDADADGHLDLLTLGDGSGRFMLGDGDGHFVEANLGIEQWPAGIVGAERLDLDGDTRDDVIAWSDTLYVWRNTADGFEPLDPLALGIDPGGPIRRVTVGDLDRDGDDDIITAGPAGLRFIRSNLTVVDPGYRFVSLAVRRARTPPVPAVGPRDGWGARIDVDLVGDDEGLPERTLTARPTGATIVTIGAAEAIGVAVHYIDLGGAGESVRNEPQILPGTFTEVFARESAN